MMTIRADALGQLKSTLSQLEDKNLTPEQQLAVARGSVKTLAFGLSGKTEGMNESDYDRYAPELDPNVGDIVQQAATGVAVGAGAGSLVPGVGNIVGGIIGGVGNAARAAKNGVRFSADVGAYREHLKASIKQIEDANLRSQRTSEYVSRGLSPQAAAEKANKDIDAYYAAKKIKAPETKLNVFHDS
jgi:hypothetical protein